MDDILDGMIMNRRDPMELIRLGKKMVNGLIGIRMGRKWMKKLSRMVSSFQKRNGTKMDH